MSQCPDGLNKRVWEFAVRYATENKTQAETMVSEPDWEKNCSDIIRTEIHHNIVSTIEELANEWYEFAKMMATHKDPYWIELFSDKSL